MKTFEIWINGQFDGYAEGRSYNSVLMRLRGLGYKTSQMDIIEVNYR